MAHIMPNLPPPPPLPHTHTHHTSSIYDYVTMTSVQLSQSPYSVISRRFLQTTPCYVYIVLLWKLDSAPTSMLPRAGGHGGQAAGGGHTCIIVSQYVT